MSKAPKVLFIDIETSPLITYTWGLFDQNIGLNQVKQESHVISWSAKWLDKEEVMYADQRDKKDITNNKDMLKKLWKLMDNADFIVGHNSDSFDIKRLNAEFIINGLKPPKSYKKIDTLKIARKHFKFLSNKLEHLCNVLDVKQKKKKSKKFPGMELWIQCLAKNKEAWNEMKAYNMQDVLALEDVYKKLIPWESSVNFQSYYEEPVCSCGSREFYKNGIKRLDAGHYQRYTCKHCGHETRGKENLLDKEVRKNLRRSSK